MALFAQGFMPTLRNNSNALIKAGTGLLAGQSPKQQLAMGAGGFVDARQQMQQRNATLEYLQRTNPQIAEMFKMGMIDAKALGPYLIEAQKPTKPEFKVVGDSIFNSADQSWIQNPNATTKPMSTIGKIKADYDAGLMDEATYQAAIKKAAQSQGLEVVSDGQGGFTIRQGAIDASKPMKESQSKANIYASRMEAANTVLDNLESEGTNLTNNIASRIDTLGNYAVTPEYRQYEQAQRDFLNAVLRQESGAVISPEEFDNGRKQYFPQPGDDPQTIAQKKRNRLTAIRAIREASGQPPSDIIPVEQPQQQGPAQAPSGGVVSYQDYFGAP